jgi:hypothetical protein
MHTHSTSSRPAHSILHYLNEVLICAEDVLFTEFVGHDAGRRDNAISKALENTFVPRGAEAQVVGVDNQAQPTGLVALARHAAYPPQM